MNQREMELRHILIAHIGEGTLYKKGIDAVAADLLAWLDAQPAAPEEMTIPEDVRNWIASAAQVASDSARYYDVDPSTSDAVLAWLDAQPAAPEPDWTLFDWDDDPPDCFIMSPWGNTLHYFHTDDIDEWWGNMPDMEAVHANSRMIVDVDQSTTLGIDWRTTLRRRPEVTP